MFDTIYTTFQSAISAVTSSYGVAFLNVEDSLDLKSSPASLFDGAYTILDNGSSGVDTDINTLEHREEFSVKVQLVYTISTNDAKASYRKALADTEIIIKKLVNPTTWNGVLDGVELDTRKPLEEVNATKHDTSVFRITELLFNVKITTMM